jgi:hypothetical protein
MSFEANLFFEALEQHGAKRIGHFPGRQAPAAVKPLIRPVRARECQQTCQFDIQTLTELTAPHAFLENLRVNPFDAGASGRDLFHFNDRQVLPLMKKHRHDLFILRDHIEMRLEGCPQFFWRRDFAITNWLERRIELVSSAIHDFPQEFLFARDVRVQTAALHTQRLRQVAHAGGVIAALGEQLGGSAVNLLFARRRFGHEASLARTRAVRALGMSLLFAFKYLTS